jgi:hypothetical protein
MAETPKKPKKKYDINKIRRLQYFCLNNEEKVEFFNEYREEANRFYRKYFKKYIEDCAMSFRRDDAMYCPVLIPIMIKEDLLSDANKTHLFNYAHYEIQMRMIEKGLITPKIITKGVLADKFDLWFYNTKSKMSIKEMWNELKKYASEEDLDWFVRIAINESDCPFEILTTKYDCLKGVL